MYDIYLITNKINLKCYVGYTSIGFEKRFSKHITESLGDSTRYLCKAIRKYGKENFEVSLIDTAKSHIEAITKERYFIRKFNCFAHVKGSWGYNGTAGGDGTDGHNVPKSLRTKLSKLKKIQKAWVGESNPNYGKGSLMKGDKHFLFGTNRSDETKMKISNANRGKLIGDKNPAALKIATYAKQVETGQILKAESFYSMGKKIKSLGFNFNRSSVLRSIRSGKHAIYGFVFYRKDMTDKHIFNQIEYEYENNILIPPELPEYGKGNYHPNAKNEISFAVSKETGEIFKFNSWYECKNYISEHFNRNLNYSEMYKVAIGKRKSARGFIFYRSDINEDEIPELEKAYLLKTFND